MKQVKLLSIFAICLLAFGMNGQKLDKFKADMGKQTKMGQEIRVPYTDVISYYGYVKPGSTPDEVRDGKNYYYLYIWVPAVAPELGVRMISPIPAKMAPEEGDFQSPSYKENAGETKEYFDTWITLERADGVLKTDDIAKGKDAKWNTYDKNDDSGEMPAQPSGSKYNSLMRITSEASNPMKALVVGLYRVGFTTYKKGDVKGGFLAQLGAPVKLPGVAVSNTLEGLSAAIAAQKK